METGTMATGRMRVFVGLTVIGSILLMIGVITMGAGEVMRLKSVPGGTGIVGLGEIVAACGLGCGLALVVTVAAGRPRRRTAARSGQAGWPARADRSRRQSRGGHTWNGDLEDAWRRDSADDWLSPLRNSASAHAAEPDRRPAPGPVSEFVPTFDYADDGWQPEGGTARSAAGFRPAEPPPVTRPGGVHGQVARRAPSSTGPQPAYVTDPQPGHESVPTSLPASRPPPETARGQSASAVDGRDRTAADTVPLPVIMPLSEHRPAGPERPPALARAELDQLKELATLTRRDGTGSR